MLYIFMFADVVDMLANVVRILSDVVYTLHVVVRMPGLQAHNYVTQLSPQQISTQRR